ncbi:MAG: hypothetical protein M3209_21055 [Acidobacteriota bacterium]|nr:hypothetical protein [Acidobacteriota bacterium]
MAKKYDTDPLDAEVFAHAEREFGRQQDTAKTNGNINAPTAFFEANTRPFAGQTVKTAEQPTQIFNEFNVDEPYKSVLHNPMTNAPVSQAVQYHIERPTSRTVLGIGIPENVAMVLPYLPFTFGGIAAVIELLLVSRSETRVRFHAAQGLALHIVWLLIQVVLTFLGEISSYARFSGLIFSIVVTFFFIFSIWRVWQGKPHHIEALDDLTDFLNEKLKPRK